MAGPYISPQFKTERAFLLVLGTVIADTVLHAFKSHTASDTTTDLPCYVVHATDFEEYPKFTGNYRGNVEVKVMTSADVDDAVTNDDPEANHANNTALVGDALSWDDLAARLTAAARADGLEFTCLWTRIFGTTEQGVKDRHFETTHVYRVMVAPSNVS